MHLVENLIFQLNQDSDADHAQKGILKIEEILWQCRRYLRIVAMLTNYNFPVVYYSILNLDLAVNINSAPNTSIRLSIFALEN